MLTVINMPQSAGTVHADNTEDALYADNSEEAAPPHLTMFTFQNMIVTIGEKQSRNYIYFLFFYGSITQT